VTNKNSFVVAGQATDFVFMLVADANPATPGFGLRADESLRLALPAAVKRNTAASISSRRARCPACTDPPSS
jgi:hypothetical protein